MTRLLLQRDQLRHCKTVADPHAPDAHVLAEGEVRLRIKHFALTANNITYAAFGQAMQYWDFFPTGEANWGCVPVWGFAEVTESRAAGVDLGRRVYGYLPMGQWLVVQASGVRAHGFTDAAAHRAPMSRFYNQYRFCDADPGYRAEAEAQQALLQPLFATAFLIDDFFAQEQDFGAQQLLLSSASSKTAYATAFCLQRRRGTRPRVLGLTSPSNLEFTRSLGCYDAVLSYGEWSSVTDPRTPSAYIDFSGDAEVRRQLHEHFAPAQALTYSASIGGTHWEGLGSGKGLPGPKPTLFFAPAQIAKRSAPPPEGWGAEGFAKALGQAWLEFGQRIATAQPPWLVVRELHGETAVRESLQRFVEGRVDPREGLMLAL